MARFYMIFNSAAKPGRAEEYSEWCRTRHFPDILNVPGVVAAKRFRGVTPPGPDGQARFVSIFEMDCDDPQDVLREIGRRNGTPEMPAGDSYDPASVSLLIGELEGEWDTMFQQTL
jgi:hypothetical protein